MPRQKTVCTSAASQSVCVVAVAVAVALACGASWQVAWAEEPAPAETSPAEAAASIVSQPEAAPTEAAPLAPLRERIDALIEAAAPGPRSTPASDAEFLRRVYLDLCGTIPDAATARAFLDDADPAKRTALVDRLLASPRFARHMQHTFSTLWTERRRPTRLGKGVTDAEWNAYLYDSFLQNKPLNQLAREILSADGADAALRPAARFYLDREAEPNLIARDVGRLFFGRDLQCAQCHDHPLVEDYLQAEYYGLMAFVTRGTLFTDAKQENKLFYAELAEGEATFKSVFTGNARDRVLPELPGGDPVDEPQLTAAEQYVVAPDKKNPVRPVPKYSRRAQLAQLATSGSSDAFNRNLANRLWAHLLGRGVVHPLDMLHSDNPPVQSELLDLLAEELVRMNFDVRAFLREIALTHTYQRASLEPDARRPSADSESLATTLGTWQSEVARLAEEITRLEQAAATAEASQGEAHEAYVTASEAHTKAEQARAAGKKSSDELAAALAAAIKEVETRQDVLKTLTPAQTAAAAAAAKLPDDQPLAEAAATIKTRATEVSQALAAAEAAVKQKTPEVQAASLKLAELDKTLQAVRQSLDTASTALAAAETSARSANGSLRAVKTRHNDLAARIAATQQSQSYRELRDLADRSQQAVDVAIEQLAALERQEAITADTLAMARSALEAAREKTAADQLAADKAWSELLDLATTRFTLAPLKPLSPEQLTWATMQAVGMVDAQRAALAAEADQQAAAGESTDEARQQLAAQKLEALVDGKLSGHVNQFVGLFGQQPGEAFSFQATVHQALFLANGGLLAGWINPSGGNLTERLAKLATAEEVAEELYLSVLTRRPEADEVQLVADYWPADEAERAAAAREMVWSLLTSSEFRFNH